MKITKEKDKKNMQFLAKKNWHNLKDAEKLYIEVLNVSFPKEFKLKLSQPIQQRHDFVHRNGKNTEGKIIKLSKNDIKKLITDIKKFVKHVHKEIENKLLRLSEPQIHL